MKGGEQVPLSELKLGYMRERDYRYKTQETANKGRALEVMTTRVTNTVKGIASYTTTASGSQLSGTYRGRGRPGSGSSLVQRTA